jgi:hypothetical protein
LNKIVVGLEAKVKKMGALSLNILLFQEKIMFKSQLIKSNTESEAKHRVDTYGATVFCT